MKVISHSDENQDIGVYEIRYMYRNYVNNISALAHLGSWDAARGVRARKSIHECCYNLKGAVIRAVAMPLDPPWSYLVKNGSEYDIKGIIGDLIKILSNQLGFRSLAFLKIEDLRAF